MKALSFSLLHWAAWAPGLETPADWQAWAADPRPWPDDGKAVPTLPFIDAMLRRRLSRLSKLMLKVAHDGADGRHGMRTVFASRHGEIHRTQGLLTDLAAGEPLSPMAFSLSVHNTASGLYSIASGNTAPSTAIAAGRDTLAMAVVEAVGQLALAEQVLLVFADEPLPADYAAFADEPAAPIGLALRLGRPGSGADWQLARTEQAAGQPLQPGLGLLPLLAGTGPGSAVTAGERCNWLWRRA